MVVRLHGQRRLISDEQLRMLGFNSDQLDCKQKVTEDHRQQVSGNSWPVIVAARLLLGLVMTEECLRLIA